MPRSWLYVSGVLVSVCIVFVVLRLAAAQSMAGTAYPPFSSLRADAQGAKLMFDVVEHTGRTAVRSYLPLQEVDPRNTTVMKLGMLPAAVVSQAERPRFDSAAVVAAAGNTVVLGLKGECQQVKVDAWKLTMQCGDDGQYFTSAEWKPLQVNDRREAQVVERKFGKGEIVLIAKSRMLSNGALARGQRAELLAMLAERRPTMLFDEESLGVVDTSSVGTLLRHYRLHGVAAAALLLFALFVWQNGPSFLPRVETDGDEIAGRDTTAGLSNLLRRTVPASAVATVAIAEWAKTIKDPEYEAEIRQIAARSSNPVDVYNAVVEALHRKRTFI